eukprot:463696-Pelagomonas_calceolata.AAC.9
MHHVVSLLTKKASAVHHTVPTAMCLRCACLQTWQALGLSDAPHYLEEDGKVRVPPKWKHILEAEYKKEKSPSPAL